jgi:hypothetical protein
LLRGSAGGFRAEAGADFHFLVVGLVVGVVCGLAAVRLGRDGPGASLGLGVGGLLAGLVAARVGYLANRGGTLASLHHFGVKLSVLDHFHLDPFFKVRALGVLVAWPIAAVIVHSLIVGIRHRSA